jgi:hypothetical protein
LLLTGSILGVISETHRPDRILLDWDCQRHKRTLTSICKVLRKERLDPQWIYYYRTRKGWHAVIYYHGICSPSRTVRLQKELGSDSKREAFNSTRLKGLKYHTPWERQRFNILFRRKL